MLKIGHYHYLNSTNCKKYFLSKLLDHFTRNPAWISSVAQGILGMSGEDPCLTFSSSGWASLGVSKVVTVAIKGNWQRWLKVRDLAKGITYLFRVQARTIVYGPELQANVTAGPAEGE